jgi:DNA-binding response OmpR family regulator
MAAAQTIFTDLVGLRWRFQPFRILLCLLENAGQVVTREQIQEK